MFLTVGWIFFAVGMIGIFVPGLPTTPFLILTAYCFSKGSKRLHAWLLRQPQIGTVIRDWEEHHIIKKRPKVIATTLMVLLFSYTLIFVDISYGIKIIVSLMGISCLIFIWTRPSKKKTYKP